MNHDFNRLIDLLDKYEITTASDAREVASLDELELDAMAHHADNIDYEG